MKFRNFFFISILSLFIFTNNYLQAQFTLDAEIRPRLEFIRGYGKLPVDSLSDPSIMISQRTRLNFKYLFKGFDFRISIQDFRTWGDETIITATGTFGKSASIDLFEAYVGIPVFKSSKLILGRQQLVYDDERLFSYRNWNQGGIAYDAIVFKFTKDKWQFDVVGSWNSDPLILGGLEYTSKKIKTQNFLWVKRTINENLALSAIVVATGRTNDSAQQVIYMKSTLGANIFPKYESFEGQGSFYYQAGKNNNGMNVGAYCVVATAYFKNKLGKIGGGTNIISGQDAFNPDNDYQEKDHMFDIFYGGRHKYYGYMDNFNNIPKSTLGGGLNDYFLQVYPAIGKKHKLEIAYHYFTANQNPGPTKDGHRVTSRFLAHEVDFNYTYSPYDFLKLDLGFSFLLPSESYEIMSGNEPGTTPFSYWPMAMLTFKPTLFKSPEKTED